MKSLSLKLLCLLFILISTLAHADTQNFQVGVGGTIKVKNRVLFAYVYSLYESEKDINWTKSKSIEWIDSILKLNRK